MSPADAHEVHSLQDLTTACYDSLLNCNMLVMLVYDFECVSRTLSQVHRTFVVISVRTTSSCLPASILKKSRKLETVLSRMLPLTRMVLASSRCSSCIPVQRLSEGAAQL